MFRGLFGGRAQRRYARGIDRFNEGQLDEAIRWFEETIEADPEGPDAALARFYRAEAHAQLGAAALDAGDWATAIGHLDGALAEHDRYPDLHAQRGMALLGTGDALAAERASRRALDLNGNLIDAAAVLVVALLDQGAIGRAGEEAGRWARIASGSGHPLAADFLAPEGLFDALREHRRRKQERRRAIEHAEACMRDGFWTEAAGRLQELVDETPDYPDLRMRLAAARMGEDRLEDARRHLDAALGRNPDFADARVLAGILALRLDRVGQARGDFEAAGKSGRTSLAALYGRALCDLRLGEFNRALNSLNRVAAEDPLPEDARGLHVLLEARAGRAGAAQERAEALLGETRDTALLVDLMLWAVECGQPALAALALERIDDADRTRPLVVRAHARLRVAEGMLDRARQLCESALLAAPEDSGLRVELATIFAALEDGEAGLRCLAPLEEQGPEVPPGLRARLLRHAGRAAEAEGLLRGTRPEEDPELALELLYLARAADDEVAARALRERHASHLDLAWRIQDPARWLGPLRPWPAASPPALRTT